MLSFLARLSGRRRRWRHVRERYSSTTRQDSIRPGAIAAGACSSSSSSSATTTTTSTTTTTTTTTTTIMKEATEQQQQQQQQQQLQRQQLTNSSSMAETDESSGGCCPRCRAHSSCSCEFLGLNLQEQQHAHCRQSRYRQSHKDDDNDNDDEDNDDDGDNDDDDDDDDDERIHSRSDVCCSSSSCLPRKRSISSSSSNVLLRRRPPESISSNRHPVTTTTTTTTSIHSSGISRTSYLAATLFILYTGLISYTEACSSRSTPKPRPPTPTPRPNITFHMYTCPPDYAEWYCLNGATCFTVKIVESLLYNCLCANGYIGQRCEFKDLDGSYLPSRQRIMLETASIAGAVTIAVFLAVITFISVYIHCKRKQKELRITSNGTGVDLVDGVPRDPELRPFCSRSRSLVIFMGKNPNCSTMPPIEQTKMPNWNYPTDANTRMMYVDENKRPSQ